MLNYPGLDYDSLHWDFGDGRTDNSLNPLVTYSATGDYTITLTVFNACGTATESVEVHIIVSAIGDPIANSNQWQIRPNPFKDNFSIHGNALSDGEVTIILTDIHGKTFSKEFWSHESGEVTKEMRGDQLPAGLILVHIQDDSNQIVLKAVHQ